MEIDAADFVKFQVEGGEAELARALVIARDLDEMGMERDKALRIAAAAARHRMHEGRALSDYFD